MYIAKSLLEIMSEFAIKGINIHYQGSRFIVAFEMQTRYTKIMTLWNVYAIFYYEIPSK